MPTHAVAAVPGTALPNHYSWRGPTGRRLQKTTNGNLWLLHYDGTNTTDQSVEFLYSTDGGVTWTAAGSSSYFGFTGTVADYYVEPSWHIDADDNAHVVYLDRGTSHLYYRRGTPNASRTAWTWSAALLLDNTAGTDNLSNPGVVAHREGTGWKAHIVYALYYSNTNDAVRYARVGISSGGTLTAEVTASVISHVYGNWNHKRPVIDFRHTGDGKTVDGQPDLFIAWNSGDAATSNQGTWFVKASYSGGVWTFGTLRNLEGTISHSAGNQWLQGLWDATNQRFIVGGYGSAPGGIVAVLARDGGDTTTTTITWELNATSGNGTSANYGALAIDAVGQLYLMGEQTNSSPGGQYRLVLFRLTDGQPLPTAYTIRAPQDQFAEANVQILAQNPAGEFRFAFQDAPGGTNRSLFAGYYYSDLVGSPDAPGVETDTAYDPPDTNLYPLVMPTYEITDARRRPAVKFTQGMSVVKVNGVWTTREHPPLELTPDGGEGVSWFRGGHEYLVTEPLAAELEAAGFDMTNGYGQGLYGNGPYGD